MSDDIIQQAAKVIDRCTLPLREGDPDHRHYGGVQAARMLADAGLLRDPERDAAMQAKAWSEGLLVGYHACAGDINDPLPAGDLHPTPNPYRIEEASRE